MCIAAAVVYGIVHDQFTARICIEYFTVFHPPIFPTQSPTLLALGWGVIATWWVGAFLGVMLAAAARGGSRRRINAVELLHPVIILLAIMGALAAIAGATGYVLSERGAITAPQWVMDQLPRQKEARFMADWWAHGASYLCGFLGGLGLCVLTFRKRRGDVSDAREPGRKRRLLAVLSAVVLVGGVVLTARIAFSRRAEQKRKREYEATTRAYAEALTQGMSRSKVEEYLRAKNQKFGQVCCFGRRRDAWADLVKIGQEKAPWFCSEHSIYVAFVFDPVERHSFPKAGDTDTLVDVILYPRLEGCV